MLSKTPSTMLGNASRTYWRRGEELFSIQQEFVGRNRSPMAGVGGTLSFHLRRSPCPDQVDFFFKEFLTPYIFAT